MPRKRLFFQRVEFATYFFNDFLKDHTAVIIENFCLSYFYLKILLRIISKIITY